MVTYTQSQILNIIEHIWNSNLQKIFEIELSRFVTYTNYNEEAKSIVLQFHQSIFQQIRACKRFIGIHFCIFLGSIYRDVSITFVVTDDEMIVIELKCCMSTINSIKNVIIGQIRRIGIEVLDANGLHALIKYKIPENQSVITSHHGFRFELSELDDRFVGIILQGLFIAYQVQDKGYLENNILFKQIIDKIYAV